MLRSDPPGKGYQNQESPIARIDGKRPLSSRQEASQ
jgi:hypothetical protein